MTLFKCNRGNTFSSLAFNFVSFNIFQSRKTLQHSENCFSFRKCLNGLFHSSKCCVARTKRIKKRLKRTAILREHKSVLPRTFLHLLLCRVIHWARINVYGGRKVSYLGKQFCHCETVYHRRMKGNVGISRIWTCSVKIPKIYVHSFCATLKKLHVMLQKFTFNSH